MCVAVPMRVEGIAGRKATLASMGVRMEADISLVEGVQPGDYVLVHAGFAIARLELEEAGETLEFLEEIKAKSGH